MKVCWFSAGVSSFIAGWLERDTIDKWIFIDLKNQHPDTMRFLHDCEKLLGTEIEVISSSKFDSVEDVIKYGGMVNSPFGAPCTVHLKKKVRIAWEKEQFAKGITDLTYVWGMDVSEADRMDRMIHKYSYAKHCFPLIDRNLSKSDCHYLIERLGIKRPLMYDLGYNNNNCIGCVKGGKGYWNKIRRDFPETFAKMAKLEREVGHSCLNGIFLDELDPNDGICPEKIVANSSIFAVMAEQEVLCS